MTGRATPRRVLADVLDLGAEAGAALAIVTATALGALLRSATDPPRAVRFVEVLPDYGWSSPDCDEADVGKLMIKVPTPVITTTTEKARNRQPPERVGLPTPKGRGV